MLPKNLRLDKTEIPNLALKGKKFVNDFFIVKVWWDNSLENALFAISISKTIDKRSTVRNTIKRKLRSAIMNLASEFKKGKYLIIVKSKELQDKKPEEIAEMFKTLLK